MSFEVNSAVPVKGLFTRCWRTLVPQVLSHLRDHLKTVALQG